VIPVASDTDVLWLMPVSSGGRRDAWMRALPRTMMAEVVILMLTDWVVVGGSFDLVRRLLKVGDCLVLCFW
jgi:hypothetical protein